MGKEQTEVQGAGLSRFAITPHRLPTQYSPLCVGIKTINISCDPISLNSVQYAKPQKPGDALLQRIHASFVRSLRVTALSTRRPSVHPVPVLIIHSGEIPQLAVDAIIVDMLYSSIRL